MINLFNYHGNTQVVTVPNVTIASPKRSDGTYTTPFHIVFATDGTDGIRIAYVEESL